MLHPSRHMQQIATAFASGGFSTPGFVHAMDEVPAHA